MKKILTPARRLILAAALSLPLYAPVLALAQAAPKVQVWKTPTCGCCEDWVKHMRDNGFEVTTHDVQDTGAVRRNAGMADYGSCHTAVVDGYAIEGHVPASDVRRLLLEKPDAAGLAAPGMPLGSPGMDGPEYGGRKTPHDVLLVDTRGGAKVFQAYR